MGGVDFQKSPSQIYFNLMTQKHTELRQALKQAALEFKHEHPDIKKKAKALYEVALNAIEACEQVRMELAAYKAPKLFDKKEAPDTEAKKEKRFYGRVERIKWFLAHEPNSPAFHSFLRWNNISLDEALKLAQE